MLWCFPTGITDSKFTTVWLDGHNHKGKQLDGNYKLMTVFFMWMEVDFHVSHLFDGKYYLNYTTIYSCHIILKYSTFSKILIPVFH